MVTRLKQPHVSSSSTETSSEAMHGLNGDNGRKDTAERRLTKPKSNSGTSLFSQRSIQPSIPAPASRPNGLRRDMSSDTLANNSSTDGDEEQSIAPHTSVGDISREKSTPEIWASVPRPTLRAFYKLHNPLGPRWYRNQHLIPPAHLKPSMRPPTFFSTSFPPIGTTSPDYPNDEELSRSSHSPLPTPESSQTRVQDGSKPRSRKTSQTAPDAIDLLDLSDPWGQSWHHKSPYEYGQTSIFNSPDTTNLPNRTRCASFSVAHARQRSVVPSPLSQSTSAVNLPSLQPEIKPPRKLSKRKPTNVTTIFQNPPPQVEQKAASVPATPIDAPVLPSVPLSSDILPKRMSIAPAGPFMSTPLPIPKREKRGSLLNRLVKKFSSLKRGSEPMLGGLEGWNDEVSNTSIQNALTSNNIYAFPEMPLVNGDSSGDRPDEDNATHPYQEDDRASLSSLEIPYSAMGKLTVVNPDPNDEDGDLIVVQTAQPIPPESNNENSPTLPDHDKGDSSSPEPPEPVLDDSPASPSTADLEMSVDKPLPPRLGTPRFSRLVMSEISFSSPKVLEQPLPPLPPKDVTPLEPPTQRDATPSSSPDHPPERPESPEEPGLSEMDPFHFVNSISLDHTAHEPSPQHVQIRDTPEDIKQSPPLRKSASPPKEVPHKPVVERRQTHTPPPHTESPRSLPGRQPSNRNAGPSPEVTPTTERKAGSLRSINAHASFSNHEPPPEFKASLSSRTNSRPESHSHPPPVQVPRPFLVPFPASSDGSGQIHTDSPLSASSVLANPPTPYDHRMSINVSDVSSMPPTVPPKSVRHQSPPPKTTGTAKRETETFKLVRSSSGNVYASSQTILAQGQQWEVVESVQTTKNNRSLRLKGSEKRPKDQDRERETDREREREKDRELERGRHRARERESDREKQRAKEREMELQKAKAREEKERREVERIQRELDIQKEREKERREAERLQRDLELQKEWERTREWERRELEREKERQREREKEKERDRERARQREREKERERQREKDREREQRERKRHRENEKERERERERRKERERRERERSREKEKEKERERRRERGSEKEREKERDERGWRNSERERERREDSYRDRRRDYDGKSREYERHGRDYEPRTDSEHKSRDEGGLRETDRRPTGYDHSSKSRTHEKSSSSRYYEDTRPHDDLRRNQKHDEHHDRSRTRHPAEMSSSSHSQHQPEPAVQTIPIQEPHSVRPEHMPAVSARPISQLPSADEMNAIRAKEQWEMERLWKARSLNGHEPNGTANHVIGHRSTSSMSDDIPEIVVPASPPPQVHGSSHTSYLVPAPLQDSRSRIYHSMPTAPAIYYHSPASIPSIPDSLSSYEPYENLRFYPGPAQAAEPLPLPSFPLKSTNPLPDPPRESPYKPALLPHISSPKRRSEHWTFNGITTAH